MANLKVGGLDPTEFLGALPDTPKRAGRTHFAPDLEVGLDDPAMRRDDAPTHVAPEPPAK
jgi:hypothetical protein